MLFSGHKVRRNGRTHAGQYEIYVAYMAEHDQLRTGEGDALTLKALWADLSEELNSYGAGPKRTPVEWRRTFRSWKNQTRGKKRAIDENRSRGTGDASKTLSNLEERALSTWGRQVVDDPLDVRRIGFGEEQEEEDQLSDEDMPQAIAELMTPAPQSTETRTAAAKKSSSQTWCNQPSTKQKMMPMKADTKIASAIASLADCVAKSSKQQTVAIANLTEQTIAQNKTLLSILESQQKMMEIILSLLNRNM